MVKIVCGVGSGHIQAKHLIIKGTLNPNLVTSFDHTPIFEWYVVVVAPRTSNYRTRKARSSENNSPKKCRKIK
jgi:hypothetical protein